MLQYNAYNERNMAAGNSTTIYFTNAIISVITKIRIKHKIHIDYNNIRNIKQCF